MSRAAILALDLGTTGNRAILFDHRQRVIASFYEEFPQYFPHPGWVEHDAEAIWASVRRLMGKAFRVRSPRQVVAIGVTNQRETVLLWDRRGKPLHRAIVWQDRRTAARCEELRKKGLSEEIHRRTGLVIDPYFSATKLEWLLNHVPGARKKADRGDVMAGTIDSWIVWKLSGGADHVTDPSNASRTMLFNLRTLDWDERLCGIFGVEPEMLPRIVATSGADAALDRRLFGARVPILGIVGDQQAAAFAQGCFEPGVVKNTYGTGLFAVESTGKKPRFSKDLLTTIAWSIGDVERVEYAVEGSVFIGGAAVQWLRDGLGIIRSSKDVEALAKKTPSTDGVYFVPALSGLGAPYWDARARGLIVGLTRGTTAAHIARATLEAIAYQTRDIVEVMREDSRAPIKKLRVDGGASANDFLMQFQADVLGVPVERPKILETTALGAAGLAGISAGFWRDAREFSRLRQVDRVFRPRRRADGARLYAKWKEAVRRSRGWADG